MMYDPKRGSSRQERVRGMAGLVNQLQVSRFLQVYDNAAARRGIELSIGFDFREYVAITSATPTKGRTYPNFRPERSPIRSGEGYWIIGLDKNKEVALTDAARLYDLSRSNLAEHLESLSAFYDDPSVHAHSQDRCVCNAPSATRITGKVAYHGDLWVRKDCRGQGLAKIVAGVAHGLSFAMWTPDFLCSLVGGFSLEKGLVAQYEMAHQEPGGSILQLVEENIVDDDWLIWLTGEELRRQVEDHDETKLLRTVSGSRIERSPG
ncbi:hypothetical protein [Bradyrhizobium sp. F1.13.3]|uniref:hypothetical protein n=1 Tax=Bradyrhizobium sp. F1.13.3 TaxID=3156351 RepID=UPI0033919314